MEKNFPLYQSYLEILRRELVPAMGCTEPIAIAYAAAKARAVLGEMPNKVMVAASGNIIKLLSIYRGMANFQAFF